MNNMERYREIFFTILKKSEGISKNRLEQVQRNVNEQYVANFENIKNNFEQIQRDVNEQYVANFVTL